MEKLPNQLQENKIYIVGDFIIRVCNENTIKINTDMGVVAVQPEANNCIVVKSNGR